jgi:putative toxin-antitoxin system antitoxin component (TIGR02293 family)
MKAINYEMPQDSPLLMAAEPEVMYLSQQDIGHFSSDKFNLLSQKLLFTQAEWADILHISDRTLQRYLKENKPFEGLYAEHLYQLDNMADLGLRVFSSAKALEEWLRTPRTILGKGQDFTTLRSFWGVKQISNELGRMEHGVYI